jgi:geranylgeranyl diphosphate synthase type II
MDNDTLRRGVPTNHVVFGESTALLAGMGLYGEAFTQMIVDGAKIGLSDRQIIEGVKVLLDASGKNGIVRGQVLDLENRKGLTEEEVLKIHDLKTAAMLKASAVLGCISAGASEEVLSAAEIYAENVGLAFQIRDDILDVTGTVEEMGKTLGKDAADNKTTFVNVYGVEKAQLLVEKYTKTAIDAVKPYDKNGFLSELALYLASRTN